MKNHTLFIVLKSLWIWVAIIPLAIINGIMRESVLVPLIGESYALPMSGISLCIMIFGVCLFGIPRLGPGSSRTYGIMGVLWVLMTIAFEFVFGMWGAGKSFAELIKAYDITTGNLWSMIVLFVGVSPLLTAKIKRLL